MPTLEQIARLVDGELAGPPEFEITGVGSLECAGAGEIAPIDSKTWLKAARDSKAGAFLVAKDLEAEFDRPVIVSEYPLVAMNRVIEMFGLDIPPPPPGIHETAVVDPTAKLGDAVSVGPCVVVGPEARIGARSVLHPQVVVESGVIMGERCVLEPGAVVHEGAELGNRVRIGANAVISRQGFGYAKGPHGPELLHHVGKVVLEDDVHIGAGSMVDRARYDETRIGRFTALDNHIHVGHNCTIGARNVMAAQTGMAGNASIGNDCSIGGQVGVANHCGVGDRCRVGAQTGLMKQYGDDLTLWWTPAGNPREILRAFAWLYKQAGVSP
jgi:UDP-3-O-[3-hydroxymyristoyl] glucosamine N-acyltransferase